ncbi:IS30 family transposase, partial [Limosilactobacillus fermentum]
ADTCLKELQATIDQHPGYFKTITFDNGSEFKLLDQVQGAQIYFAHPYSPWERGSNENQNGLIREYIPKGLSLHGFSEDDIAKVQDALNQKHLRTLGYANAAELIEAALAS